MASQPDEMYLYTLILKFSKTLIFLPSKNYYTLNYIIDISYDYQAM